MKTMAILGKIAYPNQKKLADEWHAIATKQKGDNNQEPGLADSGFSFKKTKSVRLCSNKSYTKQNSLSDNDPMNISGQPIPIKSIRSRFEDSQSNAQTRSNEKKSNQKHALKPCLVPKFAIVCQTRSPLNKENLIVKNCSTKKQQNSYSYQENNEKNGFRGELSKLQVWQQTKNGTNQTLGELKKNEKSAHSFENESPSCLKHEQSKGLMQDISRKYKFLNDKLTHLQAKNKSLHIQIDQAINANTQNCQDLLRLEQQRDELLSTKEKWENSKRKLELLYAQILSRVEQEKEKENMDKEDCQKYFGNKGKENKSIGAKESQKKLNLASRIKIRVQRT